MECTDIETELSNDDQPAPTLTFEEARVLGCLLEKQRTTPDYYPMTLAALTAACNQRSNRAPIVEWEERVVEATLERLRRKRLAVMIQVAGARVPKFKHTFPGIYGGFDEAMFAIICELLLRNVQTLSELRARTERMHSFANPEAVETCLMKLVAYPVGPLVVVLPPGDGRRVKAFAHLFCGPIDASAGTVPGPSADILIPPSEDWKARMEADMASLREEVTALRRMLETLVGP